MLDEIRTKVRGPWAVAIVLIISIPFIMFGVESIFSIGGNGSDAVTVGDQDFSEQYIQQLIDNQSQNNTTQSPELLRKSVIDQLVERTVLEQSAKDMNLAISEADVELKIAQNSQFQENGKFSQQLFNTFLTRQGISGSYYKSYIRKDLEINQLVSVVDQAEFVTPAELEMNSALFNQTRSGKVYALSLDQMMNKVSVDAKEKQDFYESNKASYMTEEKVEVAYLELKKSDVKVDVDDKEIKARFDQEVAQLKNQSEKSFSHIMLMKGDADRMAEAQTIRQSIIKGQNFSDVAKLKSEDVGSKDNGGDLGAIDLSALPAEFAAAAEALKTPGEISEPVATEAGVHLIQLNDVKDLVAPKFADSRARILAELQSSKQSTVFQEQLDKLADISFNAADLQEPAKALNLSIKNSSAFGRLSSSDEFTKNPKIVTAAFSDEVFTQGHNSSVIEMEPGHVVVLRKTKSQPSEQKSLKTVEADVEKALKESKAREELSSLKDELLAAVQAGSSDSDVQEKFGATVQSFESVQMTKPNTEISPLVAKTIFQVTKPLEGKTSIEAVNDGAGSYVVAVNDVRLAELDNMTEEEKDAMKGTLKQFFSLDTQNAFKSFLMDSAKIRIRKKAVEES